MFEPIGEIRTSYDPEIDEEFVLYQRYTKGIQKVGKFFGNGKKTSFAETPMIRRVGSITIYAKKP